MKRILKDTALLALAALIGSMAIMNPNEDQFHDDIAKYLEAKEKEDEGICEDLDEGFGFGLFRRTFFEIPVGDVCQFGRNLFEDKKLKEKIESKAKEEAECLNFFVGSMCKFDYEGETYGSVGVLNQFWVVSDPTK